MKGLELAREYYKEFGKPMLESEFADILPLLAIGNVGGGSDRFGFDDEISEDHDWEPGFCIFIPGEDIIDRKTEFRLERAYAKLPKEFKGYKRQLISPVGGTRNGVIRTADFYSEHTGTPDGMLSETAWLQIPDYALAEATNGEIYADSYGGFSEIRKRLLKMPEDVRLKRLAGNLLLMAQSGQYNFMRCIRHGEPDAAQLAACEFVNAALKVIFILNGRYMPYYKWSFRALEDLPGTDEIRESLSLLLKGDNSNEVTAQCKYEIIEELAGWTAEKLKSAGLTKATCHDLEKHAYSVNDAIKEPKIRNMHILAAI